MPTTEHATGPADADPQAWDAAWAQALTDLELDVAQAERLLADAHLPSSAVVAQATAWRPPSGLGPLPASLEVRARTLLDRQAEVAGRLAEQMVRARRQLSTAQTLWARPARGPVYVDLEG